MNLFRSTGRMLTALLALLVLGSGCSSTKALLGKLSPGRKAAVPAVSGPTPETNAAPATGEAPPSVRPEPAPEPVGSPWSVADRAPYRLRPGDPVIIYLRGILPTDDQIEEIVDERGMVTLPYIDDVQAAGRTSSELEREVQRIYIERKIYRSVTVNVVMPSQSYFIQGEVRQPQRFSLMTGTTLLQAVAAAGGYTEYADPKRVTLTRGREVRVFNMREVERNPQQDISVESGDVIRVPRSRF